MNTLNNTGIILKHFYKVPHGFELPFAGRWLKAIGHHPGAVNFITASGRVLCLGNASAEVLASNAAGTRVTTPKSFL